jgi:penicillin-binding protein 2
MADVVESERRRDLTMSLTRHSLDWQPVVEEVRAVGSAVDSRRRLRLLRWAFLCVALTVLGRTIQLELSQGDLAREIAARPVTKVIDIPARRGRILARDGTLLAYDRTGPALALHYRWLEMPANEAWLRRVARNRMPAKERRDPAKLELAIIALQTERIELHHQLAEQCGLSLAAWQARCRQMQERVERITQLVNERRDAARNRETFTNNAPDEATEPSSPLTKWLHTAWQELTSFGPASEDLTPIVVAEALDYHILVEDLPVETAEKIIERWMLHPGVRIEELRARHYPGGTLAAHAIGHLGPASAEEIRTGLTGAEELIGRLGVERSYQDLLQGRAGRERQHLSRAGDVLERENLRQPLSGEDITLTLDPRLQLTAERLLDSAFERRSIVQDESKSLPAGGAVVVLDCQDGGLLALAAAPRFDPVHFARGDVAELSALMSDEARPLVDRATNMALPPGSVMKVITAAALLEGKIVRAEEPFYCQGYLEQPDELRCMLYRHQGVGHEDLTLAGALAVSCNTYFFHYAPQLGGERLAQWSAMFGLGQATGIDLPNESAGHLPTPAELRREFGTSWNITDSRAVSIGQGTVTATPLQMARAIGVVATEGKLLTPHLLLRSGEGDYTSAVLPINALSRSTLQVLKRGMEQAVSDPAGTAHGTLSDAPVPVAAKTGTAETGGDRPDHAWIACYAPADAPRVVIVVALEHAGSGSTVAGPIARRLVQQLDELGYFNKVRLVGATE